MKYFYEMKCIELIIADYFDGLYEADTEKLRKLFCPKVVLAAPETRLNINDWLALVEKRPVPKLIGDPYDFDVISIEIIGCQAMVKLSCPLLGNQYIDYLGLLKENGRWAIVNKMYCDANKC